MNISMVLRKYPVAMLAATLLLAIPIPFALLPGFTAPLALPLFLFQEWVCVKAQLATGSRKRTGRRAKSGSR